MGRGMRVSTEDSTEDTIAADRLYDAHMAQALLELEGIADRIGGAIVLDVLPVSWVSLLRLPCAVKDSGAFGCGAKTILWRKRHGASISDVSV